MCVHHVTCQPPYLGLHYVVTSAGASSLRRDAAADVGQFPYSSLQWRPALRRITEAALEASSRLVVELGKPDGGDGVFAGGRAGGRDVC